MNHFQENSHSNHGQLPNHIWKAQWHAQAWWRTAGNAFLHQVWGKINVEHWANKQTRHEWQAEVDTWHTQRICDRNNLPDASIISISSVYLFSSPSAVDNNSHPSLITIWGQLLWLCLVTRGDGAMTYHLPRLWNVSAEDKKADWARGQRLFGWSWMVAYIRTCFHLCVQIKWMCSFSEINGMCLQDASNVFKGNH